MIRVDLKKTRSKIAVMRYDFSKNREISCDKRRFFKKRQSSCDKSRPFILKILKIRRIAVEKVIKKPEKIAVMRNNL